ncbi:MAG: fumarylacetoacetate hydrolase family protein [Chloroflexi bacterium]|nr:fumarylacetoacetate hydrolase family protein [Chloroflexota bacterium]
MLTLIEQGVAGMHAARESIPLHQVKLLAPIPRPRKNIFALGRNYAEHAKESAAARGEKVGPPVVFTKAPTTVNAPFGEIVVDPTLSVQVDWEVELAVIIGKRARKVSQSDALSYVFGYTVLNDVTARDLQNRTSQFFVGKSIDGYCPMGPWIVTADEIPNPQNLNLKCSVNGVLKQEGNTNDMIYTVAFVIEDLSRMMTLEPGDIITTGTPAGVGFARKPPEFLKPGDVLESQVEKIGTMRNPIIAA